MTTAEYQEARRLMMMDIAAVIEGCLAAGTRRIVVRDGHDGAHNILPEMMHLKAEYVCGYASGMTLYPGLDRSVDGMILLGYHAMAGTRDGLLAHTQSSATGRRYFYNGRECGEIAQHALMAGHREVPIILVSGDAATCREARRFLGKNVRTAPVKRGFATEYARLLPPAAAHDLLRRTAEQAVRGIGSMRPFSMKLPITGRLVFPTKELADSCKPLSQETRRVDEVTFERVFLSADDVCLF